MKKKGFSVRALAKSLALRPIRTTDFPFLQQLYASTRIDIQAVAEWTAAQKELLIHQQFQAQHAHYQNHYPAAHFDLVALRKSAIGRLYVERRTQEIRIIDITLLPEYHGQGIGTFLLKQILTEAKETGKIVSLHVRRDNPALGLYQRLGFQQKAEVENRFLMEWTRAVI